jgi:hypothetical protein
MTTRFEITFSDFEVWEEKQQLQDVVVSVQMQIQCFVSPEREPLAVYGKKIDFDFPTNHNSFIEFNRLTKDKMIEWVAEKIDLNEIKGMLTVQATAAANKLQYEATQTKLIAKPSPFNN